MLKKHVFFAFTTLFCLTNAALADDTFQPFKTIAEAESHCPALTGLTYSFSTTSGVGSITGSFGSLTFNNYSPRPASQPLKMSANGVIENVIWRQADEIPGGFYGFVNLQDNSVTCLYSYVIQNGSTEPLTMTTSPVL